MSLHCPHLLLYVYLTGFQRIISCRGLSLYGTQNLLSLKKRAVKATGKPGLIILRNQAVIGDIEPRSLILCWSGRCYFHINYIFRF
jgi:hypothetical protein